MDTVWWIWRRAFRKRIWCPYQDQEALDWEMLWSKDLNQESVVSFTNREVPAARPSSGCRGISAVWPGGDGGRWILEQSGRRHRLESRKEYCCDVHTFAKIVILFLNPIGYSVKEWGTQRTKWFCEEEMWRHWRAKLDFIWKRREEVWWGWGYLFLSFCFYCSARLILKDKVRRRYGFNENCPSVRLPKCSQFTSAVHQWIQKYIYSHLNFSPLMSLDLHLACLESHEYSF